MCKKNEESVEHLLLQCSMAWDRWSFVFTLNWVAWVISKTTLNANVGKEDFIVTKVPRNFRYGVESRLLKSGSRS
jgi:hypothetical protein